MKCERCHGKMIDLFYSKVCAQDCHIKKNVNYKSLRDMPQFAESEIFYIKLSIPHAEMFCQSRYFLSSYATTFYSDANSAKYSMNRSGSTEGEVFELITLTSWVVLNLTYLYDITLYYDAIAKLALNNTNIGIINPIPTED